MFKPDPARPKGAPHAFLPALAAGAAGTLGGTMVVGTRYVVGEIDPIILSLLRFGLAAACLIPAALFFTRGRIPWRDASAIGLLGCLYFSIYPVLFALSLQYTTAARGALILATTPLATLSIGLALRRETITRHKLIGAMLTLSGVAVAVGESAFGGAKEHLLGDALMAIGMLMGAAYNVFGKTYFQRHSQLQVTALAMAAGWIVLMLYALGAGYFSAGLPHISANGWWAVLYLGTIAGALPIYIYSWALGHATPTQVGVGIGMNPVVAISLGALLLSEPLNWHLGVGLACVLSGIVLANWPGRKPAQ